MNCKVRPKQNTARIISAACALALASGVALSGPAHASKVSVPPVPVDLQAQAGSHPFLVGHAFGTQNYVCSLSGTSSTGVAYVLFTPEATLFNDDGDQLITHFFSPNPNPLDANVNLAVIAGGSIRATWQHSRDSSTVWAKLHPKGSAVVAQGAIPWLLLDVVGAEQGLGGGDILTKTTQIQRLNTSGGLAPVQGCASPLDLGHSAFVTYSADYFFYTTE